MKKLLLGLLAIGSFSSFAAVTTKLKVPAQPSASSIKKAIVALKKASKNQEKSSNLSAARKLIAMSEETVLFNAGIYIDGNKQFNNRGNETTSWDFSGYCYKGNAKEATTLINKALKLGFWESDEEWIEKASADGSEVNLLIMDGPNEIDWTVSFSQCQK